MYWLDGPALSAKERPTAPDLPQMGLLPQLPSCHHATHMALARRPRLICRCQRERTAQQLIGWKQSYMNRLIIACNEEGCFYSSNSCGDDLAKYQRSTTRIWMILRYCIYIYIIHFQFFSQKRHIMRSFTEFDDLEAIV